MKKQLPIVNINNESFILKENLPMPYVHYPGIVGPFIGFSSEYDGKIYFCSCFKKTFQNYFLLRKNEHAEYSCREKNYILSSVYFPYDFIINLINNGIESTQESVQKKIFFKDKICHQCNHISPQCRVNFSDMSSFELQHAWYIKKYFIDLGLFSSDNYLSSLPTEYLAMLEEIWNLDKKGRDAALLHRYDESSAFYADAQKKWRVFHKIIENEVRDSFNYTLIGERWKEETRLYNVLLEMLPSFKIFRNYRPDWLQRLELDIFIPELSLGIEYQGIQHFQPLQHWGGKEAFQIRKEHDQRKLELAQNNKVSIIYFTYRDTITTELVQKRLAPYLRTNKV